MIVNKYRMVNAKSKNQYMITWSATHSTEINGHLTSEETDDVDWSKFQNLDSDTADTIVALINAVYAMGVRSTKRNLSVKLGLL